MASLKYQADANFQTGTLANAYTAGDTSLVLTAGHGARFPASGNYWVRVDNEILLVTSRTTDTLTVQGAQASTAAANHAANATVSWVLAAPSLDQLILDVQAHERPCVIPPSTGWSWINQNNATITVEPSGALLFTVPQINATTTTLGIRSVPATPYTLILRAQIQGWEADYYNHGVCLYESATQKAMWIGKRNYGYARLGKWTLPTNSGTQTDYQLYGYEPVFFKFTDSGSTITVAMSNNGYGWHQLLSESRTTFFTTAPDKFGVLMNKNNSLFVNDFLLVSSIEVS